MNSNARFLLVAGLAIGSAVVLAPSDAEAQQRAIWRPYYDNTGSARLQITPRHAEVFIDGYFVGTVDDFDGYLQRLNVPAGEHTLTVHLEGYRPYRQNVLFRPGTTLKITHILQPLAPGEAGEPRPVPDPNARAQQDPNWRPAPPYGRGQQSTFGTLSLRVQPDDAVVLIDGEEWERPAGEDGFTIDLPEGTHRLEVRRSGFRTYTRTFDVRRGQTVTLNVTLTPTEPRTNTERIGPRNDTDGHGTL